MFFCGNLARYLEVVLENEMVVKVNL